jgi:hypothetical protein
VWVCGKIGHVDLFPRIGLLWFDFGKRNKHVIKTKSMRFGENVPTSSIFWGGKRRKNRMLGNKKKSHPGFTWHEDEKEIYTSWNFFSFL